MSYALNKHMGLLRGSDSVVCKIVRAQEKKPEQMLLQKLIWVKRKTLWWWTFDLYSASSTDRFEAQHSAGTHFYHHIQIPNWQAKDLFKQIITFPSDMLWLLPSEARLLPLMWEISKLKLLLLNYFSRAAPFSRTSCNEADVLYLCCPIPPMWILGIWNIGMVTKELNFQFSSFTNYLDLWLVVSGHGYR